MISLTPNRQHVGVHILSIGSCPVAPETGEPLEPGIGAGAMSVVIHDEPKPAPARPALPPTLDRADFLEKYLPTAEKTARAIAFEWDAEYLIEDCISEAQTYLLDDAQKILDTWGSSARKENLAVYVGECIRNAVRKFLGEEIKHREGGSARWCEACHKKVYAHTANAETETAGRVCPTCGNETEPFTSEVVDIDELDEEGEPKYADSIEDPLQHPSRIELAIEIREQISRLPLDYQPVFREKCADPDVTNDELAEKLFSNLPHSRGVHKVENIVTRGRRLLKKST